MSYDYLSKYYENKRLKLFREYMQRIYGRRCYKITKDNMVYARIENQWFLVGNYLDVVFDAVG